MGTEEEPWGAQWAETVWKPRRGFRRTPSCWHLHLETSSLQNCEKINLCCLHTPVCSILLQHPQETNKNSKYNLYEVSWMGVDGPSSPTPDSCHLECRSKGWHFAHHLRLWDDRAESQHKNPDSLTRPTLGWTGYLWASWMWEREFFLILFKILFKFCCNLY